jgi:hypothetical protein
MGLRQDAVEKLVSGNATRMRILITGNMDYVGSVLTRLPSRTLEEPRFCAYLIRSQRNGAVTRVNTPNYVRDNIHVSLLAAAYAKFVGTWPPGKGETNSTRADMSRPWASSPIASPRDAAGDGMFG